MSSVLAQTDGLRPATATIAISGVIERVIALLELELEQKDIVVETELATDLHPINGTPAQLERLLANLVVNAIEAMSEVTDRRRVLRIGAQRHNAYVLVAVSDTGAGLDPLAAGRIFEPLFTTKQGGMGLGLAICASIVEAHGGRLWATPNHPNGSIFNFLIPASPSAFGCDRRLEAEANGLAAAGLARSNAGKPGRAAVSLA